ncbi:MAG: cell division protein ZapA [Lachnospiraceae bacterium]
MKTKTDAEVIIAGKRYNLSGYESEEYLQKIASYLNGKYAELKSLDGYRAMDSETKIVLMQINLADDYFKLKEQLKNITEERDTQETEIFNLKHDIIELQKQLAEVKEAYKNRLSEAQNKLVEERNELVEEQKKCVRLETENEALKNSLAEEQKNALKCKEELEALKRRTGKR